MQDSHHKLRIAAIVLLCLLNIAFGYCSGQLPMLVSGAAGIVYAGAATKQMPETEAPADAVACAAGAVRT
jgi:hypothetical protein